MEQKFASHLECGCVLSKTEPVVSSLQSGCVPSRTEPVGNSLHTGCVPVKPEPIHESQLDTSFHTFYAKFWSGCRLRLVLCNSGGVSSMLYSEVVLSSQDMSWSLFSELDHENRLSSSRGSTGGHTEQCKYGGDRRSACNFDSDVINSSSIVVSASLDSTITSLANAASNIMAETVGTFSIMSAIRPDVSDMNNVSPVIRPLSISSDHHSTKESKRDFVDVHDMNRVESNVNHTTLCNNYTTDKSIGDIDKMQQICSPDQINNQTVPLELSSPPVGSSQISSDPSPPVGSRQINSNPSPPVGSWQINSGSSPPVGSSRQISSGSSPPIGSSRQISSGSLPSVDSRLMLQISSDSSTPIGSRQPIGSDSSSYGTRQNSSFCRGISESVSDRIFSSIEHSQDVHSGYNQAIVTAEEAHTIHSHGDCNSGCTESKSILQGRNIEDELPTNTFFSQHNVDSKYYNGVEHEIVNVSALPDFAHLGIDDSLDYSDEDFVVPLKVVNEEQQEDNKVSQYRSNERTCDLISRVNQKLRSTESSGIESVISITERLTSNTEIVCGAKEILSRSIGFESLSSISMSNVLNATNNYRVVINDLPGTASNERLGSTAEFEGGATLKEVCLSMIDNGRNVEDIEKELIALVDKQQTDYKHNDLSDVVQREKVSTDKLSEVDQETVKEGLAECSNSYYKWSEEEKDQIVNKLRVAADCADITCNNEECLEGNVILDELEKNIYDLTLTTSELLCSCLWCIIDHTTDCESLHCTVPWCTFFTRLWENGHEEQVSALLKFYKNKSLTDSYMQTSEVSEKNFKQIDGSVEWPSIVHEYSGPPRSGIDFNIQINLFGRFGDVETIALSTTLPPILLSITNYTAMIDSCMSVWELMRQKERQQELFSEFIVRHLWIYLDNKVITRSLDYYTCTDPRLDVYIRCNGRVGDILTVCQYAISLLSATIYLNNKGILYLLWTGSSISVNVVEKVARLADMSLAVSLSDVEDDQEGIGHDLCASLPPYIIPPEMFANDISPHSDVWGFGCILYQMTTGHFLHHQLRHNSIDSLLTKIKSVKPVELLTEVSDIWIRIFLKDIFVIKSKRTSTDQLLSRFEEFKGRVFS